MNCHYPPESYYRSDSFRGKAILKRHQILGPRMEFQHSDIIPVLPCNFQPGWQWSAFVL
jgi:hypothetical protein